MEMIATNHRRVPRVAIVGARGIGKHHAKWWALEGAEVCAIAGTEARTLAVAQEALCALFPFEGNLYTDVAEMIRTERPDIVDVCSPAALHYTHTRTAILAGCHVLCEKPFVFDASLPSQVMIAQARELADLALDCGVRLGVCTQYSVGARTFENAWREHRGAEVVTEYHGHLESPAKGRTPDPERVWVDLAPHPLSVLLRLAPNSQIIWDSVWTHFSSYDAIVEADLRRVGLPPLHVFLVTRNSEDPPRNVRHFKYNGYTFEVEGEQDATGVYGARIDTPDGTCHEIDMMRGLIRDFVAARPSADIWTSIQNLTWMLQLLDIAHARNQA